MDAAAQLSKSDFSHASGIEHPYGSFNPDAPPEIKDFEEMIGSSLCKNVQRNPDGS